MEMMLSGGCYPGVGGAPMLKAGRDDQNNCLLSNNRPVRTTRSANERRGGGHQSRIRGIKVDE